MDSQEQIQLFDSAMALFHQRDYSGARELFARAAGGPAVEKAHSAQMYARMCERRIAAGPIPHTPAEHFDRGSALARDRRFAEAELHLTAAVDGDPGQARWQFALARCLASQGDHRNATAALRRAVDLDGALRDEAAAEPVLARAAASIQPRED